MKAQVRKTCANNIFPFSYFVSKQNDSVDGLIYVFNFGSRDLS